MNSVPNANTLAESLTEEALILRLRGTEHAFVERKPWGAKRDWLQAAVALANSTPIGWPAVLFVGVNDEGVPQKSGANLEQLMIKVSGMLDQAYPVIYRNIIPLNLPEGPCLAVVIPGSATRPHFAGKSYIRDGPQTKEASREQLEALIAERSSKVYELRKWLGKLITVRTQQLGTGGQVFSSEANGDLVDCNQMFFTYSPNGGPQSIPVADVDISFNNETKMLVLIHRTWR